MDRDTVLSFLCLSILHEQVPIHPMYSTVAECLLMVGFGLALFRAVKTFNMHCNSSTSICIAAFFAFAGPKQYTDIHRCSLQARTY